MNKQNKPREINHNIAEKQKGKPLLTEKQQQQNKNILL